MIGSLLHKKSRDNPAFSRNLNKIIMLIVEVVPTNTTSQLGLKISDNPFLVRIAKSHVLHADRQQFDLYQ